MDYQAICIYCICSEVVDAYHIKDDLQNHMTTSEVLLFLAISALHYGCNYKVTRLVCQSHRWFPKLLSHSRLIRKIHGLPEELIQATLIAVAQAMGSPKTNTFIVDSFPVPCCQNYKSWKRKLFKGKKYHGYCASKKQYFFGLKVHVIINEFGRPIEIIFSHASESDVKAFKRFELNLPNGSVILGDKAYTNYEDEALIYDSLGVHLIPKRKSNMKRQHSSAMNYILSVKRNKIETTFSSILARFPRTIRAKTEKGFCIKVHALIIGAFLCRYLQTA